jgi:hypothetical protein
MQSLLGGVAGGEEYVGGRVVTADAADAAEAAEASEIPDACRSKGKAEHTSVLFWRTAGDGRISNTGGRVVEGVDGDVHIGVVGKLCATTWSPAMIWEVWSASDLHKAGSDQCGFMIKDMVAFNFTLNKFMH